MPFTGTLFIRGVTMTNIAILHTVQQSIGILNKKIKDKYQDVNIINILDDSILPALASKEASAEEIYLKLQQYCEFAIKAHAQYILIACATICPFADYVKNKLDIPIIRIDEAMADFIAKEKHNIHIIGTINSSLKALPDLIKQKAGNVRISCEVVKTINSVLEEERIAFRNKRIYESILNTQENTDCIVFTQVSLSNIVQCQDLPKKDIVYACDDLAIDSLLDKCHLTLKNNTN